MTAAAPARGEAPRAVLAPERRGLAAALACVLEDCETDEQIELLVDLVDCGHVVPTDNGVTFVERSGRGGHLGRGRWRIADPAEAWETLATRAAIPADWIDDPRRTFDTGRITGLRSQLSAEGSFYWATTDVAGEITVERAVYLAADYGDKVVRAHPPTIAACVALASDVAGILSAEAIAREWCARERVVWRVLPRGEAEYRVRPADLSGRGMLVGAQRDVATGAFGTAYTGREPIFAHARALLATGYALDDVSDDAVTLLCPAL